MTNQIYAYSVPLLFKKILVDGLSGELVINGEKSHRTLYFLDGQLMFARSNAQNERLGDILYNTGKIDYKQYQGIAELVTDKGQDERIGKRLVQDNIVNGKDIYRALLYQVRLNAVSSFLLSSGQWNFTPKSPDIPRHSRFPVELPGVIAECTRKMEDFSYFKENLSELSPRPVKNPEFPAIFIEDSDIEFYHTLDRFKYNSNREIIIALQLDEDTYWQKIVLFFLLNLLDFVEIKSEDSQVLDFNTKEIIALHSQLKSQGLDYYQILRVTKSSSPEEIKDAYLNTSRKFHPSLVRDAKDPEIKDKANFVLAKINEAYEVLSNKQYKNDYDSGNYTPPPEKEVSHINTIREAKNLYIKAQNLFKVKKYWEASQLLEKAVKMDESKASYFYNLGLCQSKILALKKNAEFSFKKAAEMEPWNADHVYALGVLYREENLRKLSEKYFRKALEINIDHTKAGQMLKTIKENDAKRKDIFSFMSTKLKK